MRRFKIIIAILLFAFCKTSFSQVYPVQLSAQLIPPYSGYLPDYADPSSEKLKIILQFNDLTTPQYNIRLKLEIKGNGFTLITKQLFNPPPINLQAGVPLLLSGADLAPYLNSNNLDFIGINQNQYEQRMALPEGYYSICVKAYDYYNPGNIQVSNEACSQAWFLLNDPPFLNLPQCGKNVVPQTPQNIVFQWTPMNMSSPNSAMNTEYEFALWEVRPDSSANPNQVVLSTAPIFSTTTNLTILNYGIAEPPLNLYMKYVWRVRAKDITGRDWFKNSGYSQICTFVYGNLQTVLGNALNLTLSAEGVTHRLGKCTWNTQNIYTKYLLQVRKTGTQNWFDYNCTIGFEKVNNLEPNTEYEARVRGEGSITGDWSNIATFNTSDEPNYSCNDQTLYTDILAAQPLPPTRASIGLIIQTGQFEIITTQIAPSGPPGWYSGKGYAKVFGLLPLAVQFNNIYIDDNNRHQQGVIQALTQGINNWLHQWDVKDAEEHATYINGVENVYVNGNQICVKIQGKITDSCFAFPPNQNVIVIRDDNGNQWTVNVNPPPPTITGPTNYLQFSNDELDASDSTLVEFKQSPQQQYGFDEKKYTAWTNNYELIKLKNGKNYFVPYKSVGESQSDEVYADIKITGFLPAKLSFKTENGFELNKTSVNNTTYKVTVPHQYKNVYAWYDGKKVGKLNVISLKAIAKKVVIVPVGTANVSTTNLQQDLTKIFKQANVSFNVTVKSAFTYNLGNDGLEAADATLMSKYSPEMRALRDAYKQATPDYDKEAYYVFVVSNFDDASLKGYMVRGRALGFVASTSSATESSRLIAHELAHGAFGLEHTFPAISKNTSQNLLDYGNGTELGKVQWEEMQNPRPFPSWNDDEDDAAMLESEYFAKYNPNGNAQSDGIFPKWVWDNQAASLFGLPVYCGFIDAICGDIESLGDLAKMFGCWNLVTGGYSTMSPECIDLRKKTVETGKFVLTVVKCNAVISYVTTPECLETNALITTTVNEFFKDLTPGSLPEVQYNYGKAVWFIGSLFVGAGEALMVVRGGISVTKAYVVLNKIKPFISSIKAFVAAGIKGQRVGKAIMYVFAGKNILLLDAGVITIKSEISSCETVIASLGKQKVNVNGTIVEKELTVGKNQAGEMGVYVKELELMPNNFFENVNDLGATFDQYQKLSSTVRGEIFNYYKQQKWDKLEQIFKENKLNANWPPANGAYNIIDNVTLTKGMKFDRYQDWFRLSDNNKPLFGGSFTSPINGSPYSYPQRALKFAESQNALYYEIEILKDLPIKGQTGEVIPWFGQIGKGKQTMFKFDNTYKDFQKLINDGYVKITIKKSPNGQHTQWIGTVFKAN